MRGRGDVNTRVNLTTSTSDRKYSTLTHNVTVVNKDIYWPLVVSLTPELFPLAGMNGTLYTCTYLLAKCMKDARDLRHV